MTAQSHCQPEWQNAPIPDAMLLGGMLSPWYFGVGERAVLSADTQVFFDIEPVLSQTTAAVMSAGTINNYTVHIGMTGHEELAGD